MPGGSQRQNINGSSVNMNSMLYTQPATSLTPALIIYLIDASHSMNDPCGSMTKIDLVN